MSRIDDKFNELKRRGLDLGAPLAEEQDAGNGGRVRQYERGHIYSHPSAGVHEVHGGILNLYLEHGGPGVNPTTGKRHFGFPKSDEEAIQGTSIPHSRFEFGAIYWVPETRGCAIFGSMYDPNREGILGLPVTSNTEIAGGTACYFERGVRFSSNGQAPGVDRPLEGQFDPPFMGRPMIMDPTDFNSRFIGSLVRFHGVPRNVHDGLLAWRPSIYTDLVRGRFSLARSDSPFSLVPITPTGVRFVSESFAAVDVVVPMQVMPGQIKNVQERVLYDVVINMPNGMPYQISPHSIYVKSNWDDFGLLHITDLHICRRNEEFREKLAERGLADAAANYANFQDSLKDFIKYANRLHALGLADAVVATGDLVDYAAEDQDNKTTGNYARLRRLLLGQPFGSGDPLTEELKLPVFMTFGNHDYRLNAYDLRSDIDLPGSSKDRGLNEHSGHNLTENEAVALQDGKTPRYTLGNIEGAGRMIEYDRFDNRYIFFKRYMTDQLSYVVNLGKHRLVVLDTRFDDGVPDDFDILTLLNVAFGGDGFFSGQLGSGLPATQRLLAGGAPNSVGFGPDVLNMLRNAVNAAGTDGLVIVAMHAPAIGPVGGEYPFYMRETVHPVADPAMVDEYVARNKLNGASWSRSGTAFFKTGDTTDGLDKGVIAHGRQEFLDICAGRGVARPVDLVLMGHHHDRVEWRIRANDGAGGFEFYTDFYSENPASYYHTKNSVEIGGALPLPKGATIEVEVVAGAPPAGEITVLVDDSDGPRKVFGHARTPPYADPLNSSKDPRQWWADHRPILAQTSALGPIDPRQRFADFFKVTSSFIDLIRPIVESDVPPGPELHPEQIPGPVVPPTFQGFRFIQVRDGAIKRMRYVVLGELRRNNFKLPWDNEGGGLFDPSVLTGGGTILDTSSGETKPTPFTVSPSVLGQVFGHELKPIKDP